MQVGTVSVVVLPLSRLVNVASGGFSVPGTAISQQIEATEGIAGELLTLDVFSDALGQANVLGLLQEACVGSDQGGSVAPRGSIGPVLNFRS